MWTTYRLLGFFCRSLDTKSKNQGEKTIRQEFLLLENLYDILGIIHTERVYVCERAMCMYSLLGTLFVIISKENFHLDFSLKIIGNMLLPYSENICTVRCVCLKMLGGILEFASHRFLSSVFISC